MAVGSGADVGPSGSEYIFLKHHYIASLMSWQSEKGKGGRTPASIALTFIPFPAKVSGPLYFVVLPDSLWTWLNFETEVFEYLK